jgi:hypothetical protein
MKRVRLIRVLAAVVALTILVQHPVLAQERAYEWGWGMHHPMWGLWGIWGFAMMLMMFAFWGGSSGSWSADGRPDHVTTT